MVLKKIKAHKKSPYPSFNVKKLEERCAFDIALFLTEQKNASPVSSTLFNITPTMMYDDIKQNLDENILEPITLLLRDTTSYDIKYKSTESYVDDVPHLTLNAQQKIWQYRTYLFYQLLIIETHAFLSEVLYTSLFKKYDADSTLTFPYNPHITQTVLHNFGLGIFGSLTPTSDIDIGFEYLDSVNNPIDRLLVYVVSRFEALFHIFTDKPSLKWDIEGYGDLLTLSNRDQATKSSYANYFYLNTDRLTYYQYKKLLIFAGASMMRNILMHSYDAYDTYTNKNDFKKSIEESKKSAQFVIAKSFLKYFEVSDIEWLKEGEKMAREYLDMPLIKANKKYYELLDKADSTRNQILRRKVKKEGVNIEFTSDEIYTIIAAWATSGLYRRENYLLSPSVIHVVRTLQSSKDKRITYNTSTPYLLCHDKDRLDAFCTIGKYGYLLSILEQLGYVIRFYNTYCTNMENHKDISKCDKKYAKYIDRIENGIIRISKIFEDRGDVILRYINNLRDEFDNSQIASMRNTVNISKGRRNYTKKTHKKHGWKTRHYR